MTARALRLPSKPDAAASPAVETVPQAASPGNSARADGVQAETGPFASEWLNEALDQCFGEQVQHLDAETHADQENTEINAVAHTEGAQMRFSSDVKEDPKDTVSLEVIGEEVSHALADGGSGETALDTKGDSGEAQARDAGRKFSEWVEGGGRGPAPQLRAATGGRAAVHRRASTPVSWTGTPMLQQGASGDAVRQLQSLLNTKGHGLSVDGAFGPRTRAAVVEFQRDHGLTVDGIAGPQTYGALARVTQPTAPAPTPAGPTPTPGAGRLTGSPPLRSGSKGEQVRTLQTLLNGFDGKLTVDGDFGGKTDAAVRGFQRANGLTADGIVGPITASKLYDPMAKDIPVTAGPVAGPAPATGGSGKMNADPGGRLNDSRLSPDVRALARETIAATQAEGLFPYVVETYRSFDDQNDAFERGASKVTAGGSWHNYGLAVDIAFWNSQGTGPTWSVPNFNDWHVMGENGKQAGFTRWGGDWGWDYPHFEYHPRWSSGAAYGVKPTYDQGGFQAVWDLVT